MRVIETVLFAVAFLLVVVGAALVLREIRDTNSAFAEIAREAAGIPRPNDGVYEKTWRALRDPGDAARLGLSELAQTLTRSRRTERFGSWLAVLGAGCALAASLMTVWS